MKEKKSDTERKFSEQIPNKLRNIYSFLLERKIFKVCIVSECKSECVREREKESKIKRDNVLLPVHAWGRERPERYLQGYELALVNKIFKFQISMDISKYLYNIFIVLL